MQIHMYMHISYIHILKGWGTSPEQRSYALATTYRASWDPPLRLHGMLRSHAESCHAGIIHFKFLPRLPTTRYSKRF